MWFVTVVFLTSLGTFNSSVAEHAPFKENLECRKHYIENKEVIKESVNLAISTHLKKQDPNITGIDTVTGMKIKEEPSEGNKFGYEMQKAKDAGDDSFELDGETFKVEK